MSLQFKTVRKTETKSFLDDLEESVARGTPESRARALWHTTDLMIAGGFSEDEIWTFGEVVSRLADEIVHDPAFECEPLAESILPDPDSSR